MGDLSRYGTEELQAELRRRNRAREPQPAWKCERCGEVGYFVGHFKPAWFEIQADAFRDKHRDCLPTFGGGCI